MRAKEQDFILTRTLKEQVEINEPVKDSERLSTEREEQRVIA